MTKLDIPSESAKQIASFLVGYGLITDEQLSHASVSSIEGEKGLIETIIDFSFTDEISIAKAISESYDIDFIDISNEDLVDVSAIQNLPKKFIKENRVVPIKTEGEVLKVAISEPTALNLMSSIRLLTDKRIQTYITTFSQLKSFLDGLDDSNISINKSEKHSIAESEVSTSEARSSEVIDFTDKVLKKAIKC